MLRTLEKYELLEEIGHGGMATVYRAKDTRLHRLVAIKVMHPHLRAATEARVRFSREARSVAQLKHPNILEVYDYSGESSDESYIVAELLTGPTLKKFSEDHPDIPAVIAACFGIEIAKALGVAHANGIVHRDVKPENVLLHEDRCIKLTDFGIAQMLDGQSMTATGQILGSPGHMAPEQIDGRECDPRTDVFALGTVLYRLAVGRLPFVGRNPHTILKRIMDATFADPLRVRPSIGRPMQSILIRMLAHDPANRYPDMAEVEAALTDFVAFHGDDDPAVMLSEYLKDPAGRMPDIQAATVERLIEAADEACRSRRIPEAFDHLNRVLALDKKNPAALRLVEGLGRRKTRRQWWFGLGAISIVISIAAIAYIATNRPASFSDPTPPRVGGDPTPLEVEVGGDDPILGHVDSARSELDSGLAEGVDAGLATGSPEMVTIGTAPRVVRFQVQSGAQNVLIGVDGAAPRPYGRGWLEVRLKPGRHDFAFQPGAELVPPYDPAPRRTSFLVRPGSGPISIPVRLNLQPARLYVVSNVPARVHMEGGPHGSAGRLRTVLFVPMEQRRARRSYTVTASGYSAYTGHVILRAGADTVENVILVRTEGGP